MEAHVERTSTSSTAQRSRLSCAFASRSLEAGRASTTSAPASARRSSRWRQQTGRQPTNSPRLERQGVHVCGHLLHLRRRSPTERQGDPQPFRLCRGDSGVLEPLSPLHLYKDRREAEKIYIKDTMPDLRDFWHLSAGWSAGTGWDLALESRGGARDWDLSPSSWPGTGQDLALESRPSDWDWDLSLSDLSGTSDPSTALCVAWVRTCQQCFREVLIQYVPTPS